jgi:hypothetical protein
MVSVLISANYVFLSKHGGEQSKITDLEIDTAASLANRLGGILALDANNTFADALSDEAYTALITGGFNTVCARLTQGNINFWISDYLNRTIGNVSEVLPPLRANYSFNKFTVDATTSCPGAIKVFANISYTVEVNQPFAIVLNRTIIANKTLTIQGPNNNPRIIVIDAPTARIDFNKTIY